MELAYLWARTEARRSAGEASELDLVAAGELIAGIQRSLRKVSVIRRSHGTASNGIRQAEEQLGAMDAEIQEALGRLRSMLQE
jgi:hypothetical protein